MFSNLKRVFTLTLLASAASVSFAAPAPVSDLGNRTQRISTPPSSTSGETDVARLERLLENRNRMQLQMQKQLDDMTLDLNELRGQIERNNYDMQQMLQRQRELFVELDNLRREAKRPATAEAVNSGNNDDIPLGTFSRDADEQAAYQSAVDLILKERDYAGAINAFQQFQKDYPDSSFAANAYYWLGQLYFAQRKDPEAVKSFAAVISYPDSNKRADALVKLGDLAARNNNAAQSKKYYQQVIDEYPNSASAKVAKDNLKP
ncbi:tol-pal system protein YbgF [Vibrio cincinnatiensis]|uniref:tol-pal system protein YbgF n=1 Tax=Vibrio cincinnatiensis TaxID=675 RepID=UPI001EDCC1C5|nr:tol-pal system protein YbgF [Vibrio cincinnatiensis]MCG3746609.1 tol-pal system protein YbgF [Vibrio cincinnatiensis]